MRFARTPVFHLFESDKGFILILIYTIHQSNPYGV